MARASIRAEWVMCLRHDPEYPGRAPVMDRWQAASYASTRIFFAVAAQPDSPGLGLDDAVFGPECACAQECHDGLVDQEWAELFHEVQRQAGAFVGGCVRDAEGRFEPGGVERADTFGQEDGLPVGQGGVG